MVDLAIFLMSLAFVAMVGLRLKLRPITVGALAIWHSALCIAYWRLVLATHGDAFAYFNAGQDGKLYLAVGTRFVQSIAGILVHWVGFSFLGCMLLFNSIGLLGLILLAGTLQDIVPPQSRTIRHIGWLVLFLPGLSFWTAALGKDAIAFLGVGLLVYGSAKIAKRYRLFVVGLLAIFAVRPQIALLAGVAGAIGLMFEWRLSLRRRLVLGLAAGVLLALSLPMVVEYVGLGAVASVGDLTTAIEARQGANFVGGGAIDVEKLSFPEQVFAYMFRPLFFDVRNPLGLAASVENAFLLLFALATVRPLATLLRRNATFFVRFNLFYALFGWGTLAVATSNLGISLRQKMMFVPSLIALCIASLVYREFRLLRRRGSPQILPLAPGLRPIADGSS